MASKFKVGDVVKTNIPSEKELHNKIIKINLIHRPGSEYDVSAIELLTPKDSLAYHDSELIPHDLTPFQKAIYNIKE